jgi:hypothetical protein
VRREQLHEGEEREQGEEERELGVFAVAQHPGIEGVGGHGMGAGTCFDHEAARRLRRDDEYSARQGPCPMNPVAGAMKPT